MAGPHIVFGAGGIGNAPGSFTFTWDTPEKVTSLLSLLKSLEITELDSAANYPPYNPWNTNTLLGQSQAAGAGFSIHDKIIGNINLDTGEFGESLTDTRIGASVDKSQKLLGVDKVDVLYAHMPDAHTPLEETARAFDRLHKLGKFEKLGLCNYPAAELAKYFAICEEHGYVKPSIIQDMYNPLHRGAVEDEILPLIRKHGCNFYAYSPLAGGFLTGKVTTPAAAATTTSTTPTEDNTDAGLERTRWRGSSVMPIYTALFDAKPAMHDAVRALVAACDKHNNASATDSDKDKDKDKMTPQEATLRWLLHHSALGPGDAIIVGAKREDQLVDNVARARRGPLDTTPAGKEVREAVDGLWGMVKG
ncbi:NADP-dependent oxidoreductase domain-containing protein [Microdochium bolleyi]|uniref:NADP-dependent oxidoreductase domain-containing protein n=1 Tax=Microdochium bolleyi TaxID=196109 RepID=A0A136J8A9_9PEZI|nr:NADP-dependent oxidoreductase domain-containing protein [Microdochium bolleyi]